ncbi:MAG: response regulator [Nitrospiraceae bacterium]|nr:response regulator [Nitrospiraceae bacterium]
MHILLVEDDERIVSFMKRGLEAEEYEVDTASGRAETFDLTESRTYDFIILDIFLGSDDGLDICRTLRQQSVQTPILVTTAEGSAETRRASEEAGADAYLSKPFPFEDLLATITRLHQFSLPSDAPAHSRHDHLGSRRKNRERLQIAGANVKRP